MSASPSDHPYIPLTLFCPAFSFSLFSSNLFITSPRNLPPSLSFFIVVHVHTYPVLSQLLNDSLPSSLASYFSFIRLPPITFIFLFISSHFTSCFLCEVSAISTQLTSGAPSALLSSILLLDMKRDTSATTVTGGRSMRRRQLKAGRRAASKQRNRKKYSYCADR